MSDLNRMKMLMKESVQEESSSDNNTYLYSNTTSDGIKMGVVQEANAKFVIYTDNNGTPTLLEGIANKHKYTYPTLKKAKSKIDGIILSFNEAFSEELIEDNFIKETGIDINSYEVIVEEDEFVLKVDAPQATNFADDLEVDSFSEPDSSFVDDSELDLDTSTPDTEETPEVEKGENDADDKKSIQKWTGKLTQKLREYTETDREEVDNLVFKTVVSALDWKNITQDKLDEFISSMESKFEENSQVEDVGDSQEADLFADDPELDLDTDLSDDLNLESFSSMKSIFEKYDTCEDTGKLMKDCDCEKCKDK